MTISTLWPKQRRSGRALGLALAAALHPAFVGARRRGRRAALCPSRANAQDGKDVAAEQRRRGHAHPLRARCQHSHGQWGRDRGACRQQPKLRRLGAERALHDRSADQRSIRWRTTKHLYRSGTSSTADHILFLTSGTTPNLRHQPSSGGTVTLTSSVAIVNDSTWSTIVGTWRPSRLELAVDGWSRASSTAAATSSSALFGIYRWGWGFSTSQDFNGDIALIACFASSWTAAMVRRWHADPFGFLRPWNEVPALLGSAPPATPPSTGTGGVTFLMG